MADYADRYTDKKISQVDRELRKTYRTAQKELKQKLADFNKRFAEKSKVMKERLKNGEITKDDYRDWLTGQVFVRSRWQSQIKAINSVLLDHNKQAMNIVNNSTLDVFAENYNYSAWKAESEIAASFTIYNAESVARLILGDPQLLPKWKINEKKDYQWNYDKVNNIVRQAIIQGKGVEEITKDLCERLSSTNESKMRMFARTALGSAQNAGRQAQMDDAVEMGIEVNKKWVATHDGATRDSHRALDGEEVPENQPFSNGLMFPKDPTGAPEEIYNCRCRMVAIYPKYEDRTAPDYTEGMTIDGQTYKEWKKFDNYADWKKWKEETKQVKEYYFEQPYFEYMKGLVHAESDIRSQKYETARCIDRETGEVIFDVTNHVYDKVTFTEEQLKAMHNQTMTHNHPDGYTFSAMDIETSVRFGAREVRACHEYGAYSLERLFEDGQEIPPYYLEFAADYEKAYTDYEEDYRTAIESGKAQGMLNINDFSRNWLNENASKYGWRYTEEWMRRPSTPLKNRKKNTR